MHYVLNVAVFVRILCALKKDEPMQASQGYVLPEIASQPDYLTWQHGSTVRFAGSWMRAACPEIAKTRA